MPRQEFVVKFRDLFKISHLFYKAIGVPPIFQDVRPSFAWNLFFWLSFWNLTISFVGEWIYLFGMFGSFLQLTALAPCMCFVTLSINQMIVAKLKRKRMLQVISTLTDLFPNTLDQQRGQKIMQKKRQFDRFLYGFSGAFVVLVLTFNFVPFTMTLVDYLRLGVWQKELPYFVWYPFNAFDDRYFPFIYLSQTWAGFTTVFGILAEVFIIGTSVMQFCIQFERISKVLKEYRPNNETDNKFLAETNKQHNFILDTAEEFADILSGTFFINHICSSMVICFVGFQVVVGQNVTVTIKFLLFLFCSLIHTIMLSYFGNEIMEYSTDISSAVYVSNWMDGNIKYRKSLVLIMIRARKPQCLTGLKYTTVSLKGFTKILSSSYSYFALLRTLYLRM